MLRNVFTSSCLLYANVSRRTCQNSQRWLHTSWETSTRIQCRFNPTLSDKDDDFDEPSPNVKKRFVKKNYRRDQNKFAKSEAKHSKQMQRTWNEFDSKSIVEHEKFEVTIENQFEVLQKVMSPYAVISYEDQLRLKYKTIKLMMKEYAKKMREYDSSIAIDRQGLPCYLEDIRLSRSPINYRNLDEFSIAAGLQKAKCVGYFVPQTDSSDPKGWKNVCVGPEQLVFCKPSHRLLAKEFQTYLEQVSRLDACHGFDSNGHWRNFWVRSNTQNQHVCIAKLAAKDLSEEALDNEMNQLKKHFEAQADRFNIQAFYLQAVTSSRSTNSQTPYRKVFGTSENLTEQLNEGKSSVIEFKVHPEAYLFLNFDSVLTARSILEEHIQLDKTPSVVEWNSGTGVFTLLLSKLFRRVHAIESNTDVCDVLQQNIVNFNRRNVNILRGQSLKCLLQICDELYEPTTVVINIGSTPFSYQAAQALRDCKYIQKVIFISNKVSSKTLKAWLHLSLPEDKSLGLMNSPFLPVQLSPFDSFPQTTNYSTIFTLERPS